MPMIGFSLPGSLMISTPPGRGSLSRQMSDSRRDSNPQVLAIAHKLVDLRSDRRIFAPIDGVDPHEKAARPGTAEYDGKLMGAQEPGRFAGVRVADGPHRTEEQISSSRPAKSVHSAEIRCKPGPHDRLEIECARPQLLKLVDKPLARGCPLGRLAIEFAPIGVVNSRAGDRRNHLLRRRPRASRRPGQSTQETLREVDQIQPLHREIRQRGKACVNIAQLVAFGVDPIPLVVTEQQRFEVGPIVSMPISHHFGARPPGNANAGGVRNPGDQRCSVILDSIGIAIDLNAGREVPDG
ncbi:hypothetical protein Pla86_48630 [Planctomycetes bacterium Pla86]|uniref:Uncharacterized protein n=1 Tax=Engelhardtia mirabilis TaxID=2528011 RepID=A0A518BRZ9_9BACT|nr:hypothetical protein Pla133_48650 [Planctomycetes bacterium Pla133]QDV04069.1 hypothetical protein Pla86_48630 [Planctomycetes bacterium Pla86]